MSYIFGVPKRAGFWAACERAGVRPGNVRTSVLGPDRFKHNGVSGLVGKRPEMKPTAVDDDVSVKPLGRENPTCIIVAKLPPGPFVQTDDPARFDADSQG